MIDINSPLGPQFEALFTSPLDPDEMTRRRVERELKAMVNWAVLYGVSIPEPEATESEQIRACAGYKLPHRFKFDVESGEENRYADDLRIVRGGTYRGD